MTQIATILIALQANRRAVTALEYGLLAGVIVATIAVGFASLANALSSQFTSIGGSL
jgi:Flp pilus assembly pilin Flp